MFAMIRRMMRKHAQRSIAPGYIPGASKYTTIACWKITEYECSFDDASGFMAAYQQNASCNPFTPRDSPCNQGNYVEYAIEVQEVSDVAAGVKFAQENNVRIVIKNTGHEYVQLSMIPN
jgi:hypothetical protein